MSARERVIDALTEAGCSQQGNDWTCPAHEDRNASLSVSDADEFSGVVLHCHAGCEVDRVLEVLGLKLADLRDEKASSSSRGSIVTSYDYTDEDGELLFQVTRWAPKGFSQRRPDGNGGWINNLKDTRRVLFRLPRVIDAIAVGSEIVIVEGEKDCIALEKAGRTATTNPAGAGKWRDEFSDSLTGAKRVLVVADADKAGRKHAEAVATSLRARDIEVTVREPRMGKDASELLKQGGSIPEDLVPIGEGLAGADDEPSPNADDADHEDDDDKVPPSMALLLVSSVMGAVENSGAELFTDPSGKAWATVPVAGHFETHHLFSKTFRRWLSRLVYDQSRGSLMVPSDQNIKEAIGVLDAHAHYEGPEHEVHTRVGAAFGSVYIDLGDPEWRAVEIDRDGWRVIDRPPVRFRRAPGMLALPDPMPGGDVYRLKEVLNFGTEEAFRLMVGWTLAALRPDGPFFVLVLFGEQGSAKSTAARMLRSLIDPNEASARAQPRELQDLIIAAEGGRVVSYDNLSSISPQLSDALCRLSTGSAFGKRQLYTDSDEVLFSAYRPVIVNGISELVTRSDLMDRSMIVELPRIEGHATEREILASFDAMRPLLLGALYDAVSMAIAEEATVGEVRSVRMVDAATWIEAGAPALGWERGEFTSIIEANRAQSDERIVDEDAIGTALISLVDAREPDVLETTWADLLRRLKRAVGAIDEEGRERPSLLPPGFPKSERALSGRVRRIAPNLRRLGFEVDLSVDIGTGNDHRRGLRMCRGSEAER